MEQAELVSLEMTHLLVPTIIYLGMLVLSGLAFGIEMWASNRNRIEYTDNFLQKVHQKELQGGGAGVADKFRKMSIRMLRALSEPIVF